MNIERPTSNVECGPAVVPNERDYGAASIRLQASPSCRLNEPEAKEAIGACAPASKPMAYKPTGWPPARSGTILRLGEKRPRREGGVG